MLHPDPGVGFGDEEERLVHAGEAADVDVSDCVVGNPRDFADAGGILLCHERSFLIWDSRDSGRTRCAVSLIIARLAGGSKRFVEFFFFSGRSAGFCFGGGPLERGKRGRNRLGGFWSYVLRGRRTRGLRGEASCQSPAA